MLKSHKSSLVNEQDFHKRASSETEIKTAVGNVFRLYVNCCIDISITRREGKNDKKERRNLYEGYATVDQG